MWQFGNVDPSGDKQAYFRKRRAIPLLSSVSRIYQSRDRKVWCGKDKFVKWRVRERPEETWEAGLRCLRMLSVSHVIYHQDRYRYGVLASRPHYTCARLLIRSHTGTHIFINIHANFVSLHLSLYRLCSPPSPSASLAPFLRCAHAHKQTYISIKARLRMMNVVTF